MAAITGASEIVREYISRGLKMPDGSPLPTAKLARLIYDENPLLFKDVEAARHAIRYVTGKRGAKDRIKVEGRPELIEGIQRMNPYGLPESYAEPLESFTLPKACDNVLYLPDTHIPYHDVPSLTCAIDTGVKYGINCIVLPGDVIDNHHGSRYQPDPKKRSTKQEFEATEEILTILRNTFPGVPIYWQKGNHCIRWEKFLLAKVHEIYDDPYFHLEDRLRLLDKNIQIMSDKSVIRAGDLNITHGHLIFNSGFGGPVNPAKTLWDKTGMEYACGHLHSRSSFRKVRKGMKDAMCYTMGCLSEKSPGYNPIVNRYEHGFARQEINSDGSFEFYNYFVENGKARL
jgi:hypothetical protein